MKKIVLLILIVGSLKAIHPSDLYTLNGSLKELPQDDPRGLPKVLTEVHLSRDIWIYSNKHYNRLRLSQLRDLNFMKNQPTKIRPITIHPQVLHAVISTEPFAQEQLRMQFASEAGISRKLDSRLTKKNINNQQFSPKTVAKIITKLVE